MSPLSTLIREPLVHFVLIGAAVFGLYTLMAGDDQDGARERIVVTAGRVQQLAEVFERTWQRKPTPEELRGLVDTYIEEEVYYREAVKLGLDRDDTVIRRRMQQKLEFVTEPSDELSRADDSDLQVFLDANKPTFRVEPRFAFDQVFLNPKKPGAPALVRAKQALEALKTAEDKAVLTRLGDATLLPASMPLSPFGVIVSNFGEAFAANLTDLSENKWAGPIESPYGLHLVRVTARVDGYDPELQEIRDAVAEKWRAQMRDAFQAQVYDQLRAKYDVVLPPATEAPSGQASVP